MITITDRLAAAHKRIDIAAQKASRNSNDIRLLAVSKTKPIDLIIDAYRAGQREFGENYVQEGQDKITQLKRQFPDIIWHFIGPLQSNKSKIVAENFDWIHTIDREKIAQRLAQQRPDNLQPLNVCIQINISEEKSKSGVFADEILPLANIIASLPQLTLRGLMAIPSATDDINKQAQELSQLQRLFTQLGSHYPNIDTLSVGMSNDLEPAIKFGSTMVRIGTAIFGARDYSANNIDINDERIR